MENEEKSTEFGRYLRTHRRSKGISLEEVSEKTKITLASLRQLEDEELDKLPAQAFVKGFIQAYADVVGVDVEEAIRRYEKKLAFSGEKEHLQPLALEADNRHRRPAIKWGAVGAGCLIVGVVLFFLLQPFQKPEELPPGQTELQIESRPERDVEEKPPLVEAPRQPTEDMARQDDRLSEVDEALETEENASSDTSAEAAPEEKTVTAEQPATSGQPFLDDTQEAIEAPRERAEASAEQTEDVMVLEITAIERTWLRVTIDRTQTREVTIEPLDKITLNAQEQFDLFIGNAGGIELQLNGRAVDVPGESGQVTRMRLP